MTIYYFHDIIIRNNGDFIIKINILTFKIFKEYKEFYLLFGFFINVSKILQV